MSVGFVVHLNYENPTLSPFEEMQRFKTHPLIRGDVRGRQAARLRGARHIEGGWQSVPQPLLPGRVPCRDSAGFVNVPRIKGSHNAILSGMLCAEHVFDALQAGRRGDEVRATRTRGAPEIGADLYRVRNVKPLWSRFGTLAGRGARRARHVDERAVRVLAARDAAARQAGPQPR